MAGIRVPRAEAHRFGVIEPGEGRRIRRFREKPTDAPGLPDAPDQVLASMGNYVFTTRALVDAVVRDAEDKASGHDMGGDVIRSMVEAGDAAYYDFSTNVVPGETERDRNYWRDVGTLDAYYEAHMDLVSVHPVFNLYNRDWPIYTGRPSLPPAKFVFDDDDRRGAAHDSLVSAGVIVSGGTVRQSILSPQVQVHSSAVVEGSVLLDGVDVGRGAVVRRAILDKNVRVPPGVRIGVDAEEDRARGFTISERGVVVLGKDQPVPAGTGTRGAR